ncbi:MAG: hypothetical protein ACRD2W_22650 [Acidimicrobiales bacterium]
MMIRRAGTLALLVGAAIGAVAAPAAAVFTSNDAGCSAVININHETRIFTVDATDGEARVPRQGSFNWRGETAQPAHDHSGRVGLRIAFWTIPIASWGPSANPEDEVVATGRRDVPGLFEALPRGKYRIQGAVETAQGRCAGSVVVDVGNGAFDSVVGVMAVAGTPLYAASVVLMTRGRRLAGQRTIAGFLGLFLGAMLAVDLLVANLIVSDSPLLAVLPIATPIVAVLAVGRR